MMENTSLFTELEYTDSMTMCRQQEVVVGEWFKWAKITVGTHILSCCLKE